jgi:hypothetical protein
MLRTLVLVVFLAAWLATGIVAGIVMGRRHNQFSWSLLGVAFGALMVPLAWARSAVKSPLALPAHSRHRRTDPFQSFSPSTTRGKQPRR